MWKRSRSACRGVLQASQPGYWSLRRCSRYMTKDAELERLRFAPGRDVLVPSRAYELEARAKGLCKSVGVIASHGQAATQLRTIWSECCYNRIAARLEGSDQPGKIACTIRFGDHEVERRAIVPDVIGPRRLPVCDVSHDPVDAPGLVAHARLGCG